MRSARNPTARTLATLAAGFAVSFFSVSANGQSLNLNTSCVDGFVESSDYAELSADFKETGWDSRATLQLVSTDEQLTLQVVDAANNTVCENIADLRTSCTWTLTPGGVYSARVDNTMRATRTAYRLCAS